MILGILLTLLVIYVIGYFISLYLMITGMLKDTGIWAAFGMLLLPWCFIFAFIWPLLIIGYIRERLR